MVPAAWYQLMMLITCVLYLQVQQDSSGLDSKIRHVIHLYHHLLLEINTFVFVFFLSHVASHQQFVHIILSLFSTLMLLNPSFALFSAF